MTARFFASASLRPQNVPRHGWDARDMAMPLIVCL